MDNSAIWINSQPFDFQKSMAFSPKNVNFVPKLAMFRTEIGDFSHQKSGFGVIKILYYKSRPGESFKLSSFDRKIENRKLMTH